MYQDIFTHNFILNFLLSTFFLILNFLFAFSLSNYLEKKKIIFFNTFQPIVIFILIFILYSIILNFVILTNIPIFFDLIFYTIIFFQLLFVIKNFQFLVKFISSIISNFRLKEYIFLILILFFLITILPISDADSIALHQNLSNEIYLNGLSNINLEKNISYTIFSNTQSLLIISPILKSDNFGSQLNFFILLIFILSNFKKNKNFAYIVFASPLIIYFISAQKLQLFFGILYLLIFILVNRGYVKTKIELFISILLLIFYSSGNLSYILYSIPLYSYIFYQQRKFWKRVIIFSAISFFVIFLPIFLIKQIYFLNIFAPFLDSVFGNNNFFYNAYAYSIRSTDGWISNPYNFELYLKPFIFFSINEFSSSLGIIFLLMLLNFKTLKQTLFFPLIIVALVLSTGQILPRYYFEAFLLLAYFFKSENFITKIILVSHNLLIVFVSIGFIYFAYINTNVLINKDKFMNKFSYTYFNSQQLKKIEFDGNVLDFSSNRPSTFYKKNIFSMRTLNVLNQYKQNNELYLTNYIKNNSIDYLIIDKKMSSPSCLTLENIGTTKRKLAVRNFLRNEKINEYNVAKIIKNEC